MNRQQLITAIPQEQSRVARILVVEDESIVALDIQEKLEQLGYKVAGQARSAEAAVKLTEQERPDLVLMDVRLEGRSDGVTAAEMIRERWDVPIVFLTAHGDMETMQRIKGTNPFGYLLKPFEAKDLLTVIEIAMYRHGMERRLYAAHDQMESRAKRAAAIAGLGLSALHGAAFSELSDTAVTLVPKNLDVSFGLLLAAGPTPDSFTVEAAAGLPAGVSHHDVINGAGTNLAETLRTGKPAKMVLAPSDSHPLLPMEVRASLSVSVEGSRGPWGALVAISQRPFVFSDSDVDYLQSIANVLSSALQGEEAQERILQLSTPVLPLDEGLILVPLVGEMDEERTAHFSAVLLEAIRSHRARVVVLDVTGVGEIDDAFAGELVSIVDKAAMLGAESILCGISSLLAGEMVTRSVALPDIIAAGDLRSAIEKAQQRLSKRGRKGAAPGRSLDPQTGKGPSRRG